MDTTQLDITTYKRRAPGSTVLRFRVNLAVARRMSERETYQSYVSHIVVDCPTASIYHEEQVRYREPLWQGTSTAESFAQPRPMAFGGLGGDPRGKILAMVCQPGTGR